MSAQFTLSAYLAPLLRLGSIIVQIGSPNKLYENLGFSILPLMKFSTALFGILYTLPILVDSNSPLAICLLMVLIDKLRCVATSVIEWYDALLSIFVQFTWQIYNFIVKVAN